MENDEECALMMLYEFVIQHQTLEDKYNIEKLLEKGYSYEYIINMIFVGTYADNWKKTIDNRVDESQIKRKSKYKQLKTKFIDYIKYHV